MENINLPMLVVMIGAILSAVGSLWFNARQNAEKLSASKDREEFQTELKEKNEEIAKLNRKIAEAVTGGDSYCYVQFNPVDKNAVQIMLMHKGENPLYDVSLNIMENGIFASKKNVSYKELTDSSLGFKPGNLSPHYVIPIGFMTLPKKDKISYNINFYARNGSIGELIQMQKLDGKWVQAIKVMKTYPPEGTRLPPPTILLEQVDDGYPLNKDGKVDWDY